jgi:hypothetical protein
VASRFTKCLNFHGLSDSTFQYIPFDNNEFRRHFISGQSVRTQLYLSAVLVKVLSSLASSLRWNYVIKATAVVIKSHNSRAADDSSRTFFRCPLIESPSTSRASKIPIPGWEWRGDKSILMSSPPCVSHQRCECIRLDNRSRVRQNKIDKKGTKIVILAFSRIFWVRSTSTRISAQKKNFKARVCAIKTISS